MFHEEIELDLEEALVKEDGNMLSLRSRSFMEIILRNILPKVTKKKNRLNQTRLFLLIRKRYKLLKKWEDEKVQVQEQE